MPFAKSCPGSRTFRDPTPEYVTCSGCGEEVEIWTNELSCPCSNCGTLVTREQNPSCIDWCPFAKECIGPQLYEKLEVGKRGGSGEVATSTLVGVLSREHQEAQKQVGLLRVAILCLGASAKASGPYPSQVINQSVSRLNSVVGFFDKELRLHFRREEEILFPILEKHIGNERSPTGLLLAEHTEVWQWFECLKEGLGRLRETEGGHSPGCAEEVYGAGNRLARLLEGHIKKENDSLLPLAEGLVEKKELDELTRKWQVLGVEAD